MAAGLRGERRREAVDHQHVDLGRDQFLHEEGKAVDLSHRSAPLNDEVSSDLIARLPHGSDKGGALSSVIGAKVLRSPTR